MANNNLSENLINPHNILPDVIDEFVVTDNDRMAFLSLFRGVRQVDIAKQFGVHQSRVSQIVQAYRDNERLHKRVNKLWGNNTSIEARKQALDIIDSIKPDKVPPQSKAMSAGILIDKARLLDGETIEQGDVNIQVNVINYNRLD